MRLLFITNIPSPYRIEFFKELGKLCELTVLFEKGASDERDTSWKNYSFDGFNGIVLKGKKHSTDMSFCPSVIKYLSTKKFDNIIIADVASPTGMWAIQYMKMFRIPYFIEGDGAFAKSGKGFKEAVKRHFIKGARGYFSTSKMHDEYYLTYGAKKSKIHRYPFTSLKKADILDSTPTYEEKLSIRKELGMTEKHIVLAVGQFIHRKGFDVLLNAIESLCEDVGVYFVGGEPTEEYLRIKEEKKLLNAHFIGFKNKEELKKYYIAADLFVHPTREDVWGLVINEAMACGLPVITTDRCIAGLELVADDINGYIIDTDDSLELSKTIEKILSNDENIKKMAHNSIKKIGKFSIEEMVRKHIAILNGD